MVSRWSRRTSQSPAVGRIRLPLRTALPDGWLELPGPDDGDIVIAGPRGAFALTMWQVDAPLSLGKAPSVGGVPCPEVATVTRDAAARSTQRLGMAVAPIVVTSGPGSREGWIGDIAVVTVDGLRGHLIRRRDVVIGLEGLKRIRAELAVSAR